jgi:hypothetical protein
MRGETRARESAIALPGIGGALLAKAACPACWTLVAGGLGSFGLVVELSTGTLRLLGLVFLTLALSGVLLLIAASVWNAWPRRVPLVRLARATRGTVPP